MIALALWFLLGLHASVFLVSLVKVCVADPPHSWHSFCETFGMCLLWPVTLGLEFREWRWQRNRKAGQ